MKLRKILCLMLTLIMAASAFSVVTVNAAAGPSAGLDDDMIIHWDFEGETQDEQLANKAENGDATDSLRLDTVGNSTIEEGVANISGLFDEQLVFQGDGTKGAKLDECKDGYTFYIRFKVSMEGEFKGGTYPYSLFWLQGTGVNLVRCMVQQQGADKVGPRMLSNICGDTTNAMPADTFWLMDEFTEIAVTVNKLDSGKYEMTIYSGSTISSFTKKGDPDDDTDIMNSFAQFVFASGKKINTVEHDQYYVEFTKDVAYDDIRVYNRALSFDEVKALSYEVTGVDPDATIDVGDFTFGCDNTTAVGDDTTVAGDNTTAASDNTADADGAEVEEKGGCGSAIMGMALIPAAVAVGAAVIGRKKKD